MSIWISWYIVDFINNIIISSSSILSFLRNEKNLKVIRMLFYLVAMLLITGLNVLFISSGVKSVKSIIKIFLCSIICKYIFKEKFSQTLIQIFLTYILFAVCDGLVGVFYLGIFNISIEYFNQSSLCILSANFIIALLVLLFLRLRWSKTILQTISDWYDGKHLVNLLVTIILCVISVWFFLTRNTNSNIHIFDYVITSLVITSVVGLVIGFFKEISDKNKIKRDYDMLLNYAKTYEQEIIEKSKWQHEYENQLIIVRDKIDSENKNAIAYINKLLKNKPSDENSQWLGKLSKFPDIGIKGLLHYKICQMIKNDIHVYVDVIDDNVNPLPLPQKHLEANLQDISMALGVYLDNAVQASIESSTKYVIVEFQCTGEHIMIQISNTYKGNAQLEKMNQERFTTKGAGHGYGLSIVKDIIERNECLTQEREINGMYYVQKLIINIKNRS